MSKSKSIVDVEEMKTTMPLFGFSAGVATAFAYLPHILFLSVIAVSQSKNITLFFLMFTVGARILGDWIFWSQMFPSRMDSRSEGKDWRLSIKNILLSNPTSIRAAFDIIVDFGIDALLVFMALKASAPPVWIFLVFSACQAIGAPLNGIMIYVFSKKNIRLFSMVVTALAVFAALEINGILPNNVHADMFGLSNIEKSLAVLLIIGAKCLFTGITVIGKTSIAETIGKKAISELVT